MISVFAIICPFCVFEFSSTEIPDNTPEDLDSKMGELFSNEDYAKLKYLRTQIRRVYHQVKPINRVWDLFKEKWGHQPPSEWHRGAVFGKHDNEANRQRYLNYLHTINPKAADFWIRFQMGLEFGFETQSERTHQHHAHSSNTPQKLRWWTVLGVLPGACLQDIKSAYRRLALKYHPDSRNLPPDEAHEKMLLLNWAYEQAQLAG
jgi:hypothetical protein